MTDYKNEFYNYLINVKKSSANTVESYMRDIDSFLNYLNSFKIKPEKVTTDIIEQYTDSLTRMGRSTSTITRVISSIRCYFRFLKSKGNILDMPTHKTEQVKKDKKLPEILSEQEIELLLMQPKVSDMKGLRDKAMLEILYATGIRVSELIELKVEDVNLQMKVLHCKNGKNPRYIPIYDEALHILMEYITKVRPVLVFDDEENTLFTNMNGSPMTRQGFWKIVKQYSKQAGIKKDITPHTLRHSFAAHLLENGANIVAIKDMLGHCDISSTNIYTRILEKQHTSQYASEYVSFHPKAKRA